MTPEGALSSYRRFLTDRFTVIRKVQGSTVDAVNVTNVQGRVMKYTKPRAENDNTQGWQEAVVLAQDLIDKGFPVPMKTGDLILVQGRTLKVDGVDQNTRKVGQTLIAYQCICRGS
jgi:hypothetical protein